MFYFPHCSSRSSWIPWGNEFCGTRPLCRMPKIIWKLNKPGSYKEIWRTWKKSIYCGYGWELLGILEWLWLAKPSPQTKCSAVSHLLIEISQVPWDSGILLDMLTAHLSLSLPALWRLAQPTPSAFKCYEPISFRAVFPASLQTIHSFIPTQRCWTLTMCQMSFRCWRWRKLASQAEAVFCWRLCSTVGRKQPNKCMQKCEIAVGISATKKRWVLRTWKRKDPLSWDLKGRIISKEG